MDDHGRAALEQADQVLRAVAFHAAGVGVGPLELLLGHVAIIALELLLGAQLDAEVGHLALAALSVLAGTIFALVRSEEHTSELQSLMRISYAVFCLKKKILLTKNNNRYTETHQSIR